MPIGFDFTIKNALQIVNGSKQYPSKEIKILILKE